MAGNSTQETVSWTPSRHVPVFGGKRRLSPGSCELLSSVHSSFLELADADAKSTVHTVQLTNIAFFASTTACFSLDVGQMSVRFVSGYPRAHRDTVKPLTATVAPTRAGFRPRWFEKGLRATQGRGHRSDTKAHHTPILVSETGDAVAAFPYGPVAVGSPYVKAHLPQVIGTNYYSYSY